MKTRKIRIRERIPWAITEAVMLLTVMGWSLPSYAEVWIWDSTHQQWSSTLTDGGPIDTTHPDNAVGPRIAIDSNGNTYVAFTQDESGAAGIGRIYLSRYDSSGKVTIWDNDTRSWTANLTDGDPIDTGISGRSTQNPQLAVDSNDRVYVVFSQSDGTRDRVYLSRYNGTDVRIYSSGLWVLNFSSGSPIDANTGGPAQMPRLAIDSGDQVYVTFYQDNGDEDHIYLCRYNGVDVRIWDSAIRNWTANFANGDPIDTTLPREASDPTIAIDSGDNVYVAYRQNDGIYYNIYLSRFSAFDGVQIWDAGTQAWSGTLADGDPVGLSGASGDVRGLDMTVDSTDQVYLAYIQQDAGIYRVFLSRYNTNVAQIWNGGWKSDTFASAQPIDTGATNADIPRVIADGSGNIYVCFAQLADSINRIHLSRWNGTDMQIWDTGTLGWTTALSSGDPIDAATGYGAASPEMTVDTSGRVYVTFQQSDGKASRVYLSRYDDTPIPSSPVVEIWDRNAQRWTTTFGDGDPIDAGTGNNARNPQLAASSTDEVFFTYDQNDGSVNHVYLSAFEPSAAPPSPPNPSATISGGGGCFLSAMPTGRRDSRWR
jgi:hypothetical protein